MELPRVKTKMWLLEFTATPVASPRWRSGGSFRKSGTEWKRISGVCWAKTGATTKKKQNEEGAFHVIEPRDFAPHHTRVWGISRLLEICIELRREELRRGGPGERVENRQRVYWI